MVHYHLPALVLSERPGQGTGVFTTEAIEAGTVVVAWGGTVSHIDAFSQLDVQVQTHAIQIAEELFLVPPDDFELPEYVNHSCDPNCGLMGPAMLVAMRRIEEGEQLCFDYAMADTDPYDEFDCRCGTELCRGRFTGEDWMLPALWSRYDGWFSTYLQRRIDGLREAARAAVAEVDGVSSSPTGGI